MTSVAIHQPNYLPWLGYFHKLASCDVFVYLDSVQYPRGQSLAARNRIKTPQGATWLTVPVRVPKGQEGKAAYTEVEFAQDGWRDKHARTVEMNYRRAPHFDAVMELYRSALDGENFVETNIALIDAIVEYLGIDTPRVRLSSLMDTLRDKTELIVDICRAVDADAYLSGTGGGRDYNDENLLREHGIALQYDAFEHPEYPQLWGDFVPAMSAIDLLFNCGPDSREVLLGG